jgi:hypothetical protein
VSLEFLKRRNKLLHLSLGVTFLSPGKLSLWNIFKAMLLNRDPPVLRWVQFPDLEVPHRSFHSHRVESYDRSE